MRRIPAAVLLIPALLLTACPDKEPAVPPVEEEVAAAEKPPAKESVCDCTCEGEGCRCVPLTWRVGCICHDLEMNDCACDCKGEPLVSVDEVTIEAIMKADPDTRIEVPSKEELAEEIPPPPPPPPDAS